MDSLSKLAEILRQTLCSVERNTDLHPDDPALLELQRILRQRIAVLETAAALQPHVDLPPIWHKSPVGPD